MTRWRATITYRTDSGPVEVPHDIEELHEIQALVERGPDWNCIERIEIVLQRANFPDDTVEQAAKR